MLYKKPKNMKYTDMAIYVDSHVYEPNCDEDLIFQYLYHLAIMLARNNKWFNNTEYYDNFAIMCATRVFMRLKNKKQYELNANGEYKMTKIKSCLNYMKIVAYPCKVDFEQSEYAQTITFNESEEYDIQYTFGNQIADSIDKMNLVEFESCLGDIIKSAKNYIDKIPYRSQSVKWTNIYLSCLLTYLNSITLKNKDIQRINNLKYSRTALHSLDELYKEEFNDCVILYHLNDNLHDYIYVLTNGMRRVIAKDLTETLHTYVPTSSNVSSLIFNELTGEGSMNNEN